MAKQLFSNNASTTLAVAINAAATTVTLPTGKGALFSTPTGGDYELVTITDSINTEVVKVTANSIDVLTVTRAQEGTVAQSFSVGARVEARVTKGMLETLRDAPGVGANSTKLGVSATTASTLNSTAVGSSASVSGDDGVAIGKSASAATDGTACGSSSTAGVSGVAVGRTSSSHASGVAVGYSASNSNINSIAVGYSAVTTGSDSAAIGNQSSAAAFSVVMGSGSTSTQSDATAVGYNIDLTVANAVAVGSGAAVTSAGGIAIGKGASATSGVTIGDSSNSDGASVLIGRSDCPATPAAWAASASYAAGDIIRAYSAPDYYVFVAQVAGTSASSAPTWPTTVNHTVTDGGVTWLNMGYIYVPANSCILIGDSSHAAGAYSVTVGTNSFAVEGGTAVGYNAYAPESSVAVGNFAGDWQSYSVTVGSNSNVYAISGIALGSSAVAGVNGDATKERITAIGSDIDNRVSRTHALGGMSIARRAQTGWSSATEWAYSSQETCVFSEEIDLKTVANDVLSITMPTGSTFFPDETGLIITTASGATGGPQVSFGITGNTTSVVAQTATSKTTVGGRTKFTPISGDAVSSITASVKAAATGTTLKGRFYVKGILVESQ